MKKIILIFILFLISSCASVPVKLSSTPLPAEYEEIGKGSGRACSVLLFGVIPITFNSMPLRAYNAAIFSKGGDALINPEISESWYWIYVGNIYCERISGTVIKTKK